jgi:hypothetical protein
LEDLLDIAQLPTLPTFTGPRSVEESDDTYRKNSKDVS